MSDRRVNVRVSSGAGWPIAPSVRGLTNLAVQSVGRSRPVSTGAGSLHSVQSAPHAARTRTLALVLDGSGANGQVTSTCSEPVTNTVTGSAVSEVVSSSSWALVDQVGSAETTCQDRRGVPVPMPRPVSRCSKRTGPAIAAALIRFSPLRLLSVQVGW